MNIAFIAGEWWVLQGNSVWGKGRNQGQVEQKEDEIKKTKKQKDSKQYHFPWCRRGEKWDGGVVSNHEYMHKIHYKIINGREVSKLRAFFGDKYFIILWYWLTLFIAVFLPPCTHIFLFHSKHNYLFHVCHCHFKQKVGNITKCSKHCSLIGHFSSGKMFCWRKGSTTVISCLLM